MIKCVIAGEKTDGDEKIGQVYLDMHGTIRAGEIAALLFKIADVYAMMMAGDGNKILKDLAFSYIFEKALDMRENGNGLEIVYKQTHQDK